MRTFTLCSTLLAASTWLACTSAEAQTARPITSDPCPAAWAMTTAQLQGQWRAEFPETTDPQLQQGALLDLGPHPEWAGTVKGTVTAGARTALMVGDVNDGEVTLEASEDGQRISATWLGEVEDGSCGQRITGQWWADNSDTGHPFVLHKQPR